MKFAALSATALAALGVAAAATPSFAQDYRGYGYGYGGYGYYDAACAERQHDSGVNGAVLGGIAGALLGSGLAGHGGHGAGAAIGGVAGAVIGNNIARSNARSSDECQARDYGRVAWRRPQPYPDYGRYERGYQDQGYYGRGAYDRADDDDNSYTVYEPYGY
jgi:hypothetical protein